jgi:hypothetical protein
MWAHPDRKNSSRSLSEVSVSNAERIGKRPPDLAASNLLQMHISATSSSSPARRSANLVGREVAGARTGYSIPLTSVEAQEGWPPRARRGGDPA